jgi:hypothetical protein
MTKTEILEQVYPLIKELAKFETVYGSMAYLPCSPRVSMAVSYWAGDHSARQIVKDIEKCLNT